MKLPYLIPLCQLFAIAISSLSTAKAQVDVNDSLALVDLYNSTNGPDWNENTNWLTTAPVSTWYGIEVTGSRVTVINMPINNLNGTIPPSIGNLRELSHLGLAGNRLSGSIPNSIGNLVNLTYLDFGSNLLSSSIPFSIGNLINLQVVDLSQNELSGCIPSSIGKLTKLQNLEFSNNKLSGSIPASVGNLISLTALAMMYNQLYGKIPASMGKLSNLYVLYLNNNFLSGNIPASLGDMVSLQAILLSFNQLSGSIPASIGNLTNLSGLILSNNQLSGNIPESFRKLHNLYSLDLSHNQLSQSSNVDYPLAHPHPYNYADVSYNQSTFNGLEFIAKKIPNATYAPQAIIPVHQSSNTLSVYAGGTLSNNTYNWFKVGAADSTTITGDSTFSTVQSGRYYVKVTNAIATQLTLYSDTVEFTVPALGQNKIALSSIQTSTHFAVYPNPARTIIHVQTAGTALITITNTDGKVMLTKTITNNSAINISSLAPGIYYVQNKATGEVKKVVASH